MKVVMINDCAFVGQTLEKYFAESIIVEHIKRTRSFFGKTFGMSWRVLRAKGDIYHAHYLLQDCYVASKLNKKPLIGHAHGTDIRENIKRFFLRRIVRHNLKHCDKVIVATPNLLETALKYNDNTEYVPNPVDTALFYPMKQRKDVGKLKVLIAGGSDWRVKGTDKILRGLKIIEKDVEVSLIKHGIDVEKTLKLSNRLDLNPIILPYVSHENMSEYYWNADVVVASIGIGGTLGMVALEAIACGRPTIAHISSRFDEYKDFPLLDVSTPEGIAEAISHSKETKLWEEEYQYINSHHSPSVVAENIVNIYSSLVENGNLSAK